MPAGLNQLDLAVFVMYLAASVGVGFLVSRGHTHSAGGYFLGDRRLPWYVVSTSLVSTVVSTEHFIAQSGAAYSEGMVVAAFSWNAWIVYTLLIWIFLPYYMRTGIYTMPEFLERRYHRAARYLFAFFLAAGYIASIIAGTLYAGGLALESLFGLRLESGILLLAVLTGAYTIYGGLTAAAWTDFLQLFIILGGGILVPLLGLGKTGGLVELAGSVPEKFQVFHGPSHPLFPATGVFTSFLSIGIWYNCTSQHVVQRCLGARNEWHARMGVVGAGFLQLLMPFFFVLPGIIAFRLYPGLSRPDQAYLTLVQDLIPAGLRGVILAAMAAALMSTLSSMINSVSTIATMDLYKRAFRPAATERQQVRFGRVSGTVALVLGVLMAYSFSRQTGAFLFVLIQDVFAYIAPPFAVVFTAGILWRRANTAGALATICLGLPFGFALQYVIMPQFPWLELFSNYLHRALATVIFSLLVMVVVSRSTSPPREELVKEILWHPRYAALPPGLRAAYRGVKDFRLWWLLFVAAALAIYGFFLWFRFRESV